MRLDVVGETPADRTGHRAAAVSDHVSRPARHHRDGVAQPGDGRAEAWTSGA